MKYLLEDIVGALCLIQIITLSMQGGKWECLAWPMIALAATVVARIRARRIDQLENSTRRWNNLRREG